MWSASVDFSKRLDQEFDMERDNRFPTGEWNGFYLESHQPRRGWMHLYLSFENGKIAGEGTDYVGPWTVSGVYDSGNGRCSWTKQYIGKHKVNYKGIAGEHGIQGEWLITYLTGEFHIWPRSLGILNELYLQEELNQPVPSIQLGTVPTESNYV